MEEIKQMANALWLTDDLLWDIALYWIFLINLILLFMQPEGSAGTTLMAIIVILAAVIDKVHAFGYMLNPGIYTPEQCHNQVFLGTYLIRVAMFALPLSIAGMTKNAKSRGVGIIAGISGGAYMFMRWFVDQREVETTDLKCACLFAGMLFQNAGMILVLARIALRDRLCLGTIHRDIPVTVFGDFAPNDLEV